MSPDESVVLDQLGQRVVERLRHVGGHVVRLHVENEPPLGGIVGHPPALERVGRARPLEDEQRREHPAALSSSLPRRPGKLSVDVRAAHIVDPDREELDVRSAALTRHKNGIGGDGIQSAQLGGPEGVEVRRPAARRPDLPGCHRRTEQDPADFGLAGPVEAGRSGRRPHLDEDHPRSVERCFDRLPRRQVQRARADHRQAVALERVAVHPGGGLSRGHPDVPPHALTNVVDPVRVVGRERQLLRAGSRAWR